MAYYMSVGDYYGGRGDYYTGRGGIFDFLGKVARTVTGAVSKAGIPLVSGAAGVANRILSGAGTTGAPPQMPGLQLPAPMRPGQGIGLPGPFRVSPTRILPGGQPFLTREGGACPPGHHLDKRTGSYCVKNRRMNPANPRALRRAIRREKGFVVLARRVLRGTGISVSRRNVAAKPGRKR
ncbi:MAG: hypothetical protein L0214_14995 [candidate division NC10 bacterium]|nr:hypothetical protein [candidate division NC10 bacterium]